MQRKRAPPNGLGLLMRLARIEKTDESFIVAGELPVGLAQERTQAVFDGVHIATAAGEQGLSNEEQVFDNSPAEES